MLASGSIEHKNVPPCGGRRPACRRGWRLAARISARDLTAKDAPEPVPAGRDATALTAGGTPTATPPLARHSLLLVNRVALVKVPSEIRRGLWTGLRPDEE